MKKKYLILFSLCGLVLSLDQFTKYLVTTSMKLGDKFPTLSGLISVHYTTNNGFAFGFLKQAPPQFQDVFFIGIPIFALILILLIFIKLRDDQIMTSIALTTILGGAIGNLIDRVQYGHVIDFIDVQFLRFAHIPPFNIADCSIIMGVIIMFFNTLTAEK